MRIIAVDDEKMALESVADALIEVCPGVNVTKFTRPDAALEYARENPCDIAFLDVQMPEVDGVELARKMKEINPKINIIFTTGYSEYMVDAFDLHVSGYIVKPITAKKIQKELANLRHPIVLNATHRVRIRCFGNFEIFVDNKPISFRYEKAKEMLAYMVDRSGAMCTSREIMLALFDDEDHASYIRNLRKNLMDTLASYGVDDIVVNSWGKMAILPDMVECDYYDWKKGKRDGDNSYRGEYMTQFKWAESVRESLKTYL